VQGTLEPVLISLRSNDRSSVLISPMAQTIATRASPLYKKWTEKKA